MHHPISVDIPPLRQEDNLVGDRQLHHSESPEHRMGTVWTGFERRMAQSLHDTRQLILPLLRIHFPQGDLIEAEGKCDELSMAIDRRGKIDYLYVPEDGIPYGIAMRATKGTWDQLTLGPAQYQELCIRWPVQGATVPALLVQGYIEERTGRPRRLHSLMAVKTGKFLQWTQQHPGEERPRRDGGIFLAWSFDDLFEGGISEFVIPVPSLRSPA